MNEKVKRADVLRYAAMLAVDRVVEELSLDDARDVLSWLRERLDARIAQCTLAPANVMEDLL